MKILLLTTIVMTSAAPAAATTPLGLSCLGCHQTATNSPEMPALDRLSVARIAQALRAARDAPQAGSIMARFSAHLTDAQIDALAVELGRKAR